MARNYKGEYEWGKRRYDQIRFRVSKKQGDEFRKKLEKNKITMAEWGNKQVSDYMKEKADN